MAFNPFKSKPPVDKPSRNAFDLSFANNLTMEFGKLYPVFCKECLPGDTFKIDPTFAFKFMPMYFPVQSRMRADLKFFYVRNRNLWKNWKKFIGQTDRITGQEVAPPYLKITPNDSHRLATRSLLDYLGVPTTAPQLINSRTSLSLGGYSSEYANEVLTNMYPVNENESTSPFASTLTFPERNYPLYRIELRRIDNNLLDSGYYLVSNINTPFRGIIRNGSILEMPFVDKLNDSSASIFDAQYDGAERKGQLYFFKKLNSQGSPILGSETDEYELVAYTSFTASREGTSDLLKTSGISSLNRPEGGTITIEELTTLYNSQSKDLYISIALPYIRRQVIQTIDKCKQTYVVFPFALSFYCNDVLDAAPIANRNPFITQTGAEDRKSVV